MASWKKFGSGEYGSGVLEITEVDRDLYAAGSFCAKATGDLSRDLRRNAVFQEMRGDQHDLGFRRNLNQHSASA